MNAKPYGGSWRCFPSTKTLASSCGISERAVCTHLGIAERTGWLIKRPRGFGGKGWRLHEYVPCIPHDAAGHAVPGPHGTESDSVTEQTVDAGNEGDVEGVELPAQDTEADDVKVLKEAQSTNQLPTNIKQYINRANARFAHRREVEAQEQQNENYGLQFDTDPLLQQAVKKLSTIPGVNAGRAKKHIVKVFEEYGEEQLKVFLTSLPADAGACLEYFTKRPKPLITTRKPVENTCEKFGEAAR